MNVLVIPEDFVNDQYILRPIVSAMLSSLGKPRSKITICYEPRLGSVSQALRWERIAQIIDRYRGMYDLFLLCIDRDGQEGRRVQLDMLEHHAQTVLDSHKCFLAENAWQEVEVWVLAGHHLPADWSWKAIRAEINPKEWYFDTLAKQRGLIDDGNGGRNILAREAARRYGRIRQLCPEDIGRLEARIGEWIAAQAQS